MENVEIVGIKIRLKDLLEERGLTQKQLHDMTGIRPAAISALARGYVERLTIDHLVRIANALELGSINELISFEKK